MTTAPKSWLLPAALALTLAGCGGEEVDDKLPRQPVWGTVTLDGQPLAAGSIQFVPASAAGGAAAAAILPSAKIDSGSYAIDRAHGPVPGTYKVAINATAAPSGEANRDTNVGPGGHRDPKSKGKTSTHKEELIPEKYNAQTTLEAVVKEGGDNKFDFELKSK